MQDRPKPSAPIRYQHGPGPQIHPARRTALGDWAGKPTSAALCKRPNGPLKPPSHRPSAHFTHSITKTLAASTLGGFPTRVVRPPRPYPHAATRIGKPSPEKTFRIPLSAAPRLPQTRHSPRLQDWRSTELSQCGTLLPSGTLKRMSASTSFQSEVPNWAAFTRSKASTAIAVSCAPVPVRSQIVTAPVGRENWSAPEMIEPSSNTSLLPLRIF